MTTIRRIALFVATALLFAACGDGGATTTTNEVGNTTSTQSPRPGDGGTAATLEPGSVELEFLVFETPNLPAEYWDEAIARVVAEHPQFDIHKIIAPDLEIDNFLTQLAATDQLPDIMMSNFPTAEFIEQGLLLPFEESDLERFVDPVGLGLTDGKQYALPQVTVFESAVFYNADVFERAGISDEPETWEDYIAAAEAVEAIGETSFVVGGAGDDRWAAAWPLLSLVTINVTGPDPGFIPSVASGEASFGDNEEFLASVAAYSEMVERGWVVDGALSLGYAELQQQFLSGVGAMYPMGSFFAGAVPVDHPFEIGVFPLPTFEGEPRLATFTSGGPAVSAKTENSEQARLFAVEFATNAETNLEGLVRDAQIPNNHEFVVPEDFALSPLILETIEILDAGGEQVPFFSYEVGDAAVVPGFQNELNIQAQEILAGVNANDVVRALDEAWVSLAQ